jgi:hypothetical protein
VNGKESFAQSFPTFCLVLCSSPAPQATQSACQGEVNYAVILSIFKSPKWQNIGGKYKEIRRMARRNKAKEM